MKAGIKFRIATIDDLPSLVEVGNRLFDNEIKTNRAQEFLNDPRHHLVLANHKARIVGMASGFHYVHPDKDPQLFINEVSVIEVYQNQGIGRRLVRFLTDHGKGLGCIEAWVLAEKSNEAARKAYAASGGIEDKEPTVLIEIKTEI